MSIRALLRHRADVYRLTESQVDGMPTATWRLVAAAVPCFVDLNFIRRGKDPTWTPESGRATDRSGVAFTMDTADVRSGDRLKISKGPAGTFQVEGAVDEAWKPERLHHMEFGVVEVPSHIGTGVGTRE